MGQVLEKLKAISIRQPWAEQIMTGEKTIEYRSLPCKFRGRIYIYASLGKSDYSDEELEGEIGFTWKDVAKGVVIGSVEIVDCTGEERDFEWHLENPVRLETPIPPTPGQQPGQVWFYPFGKPPEANAPVIKKGSSTTKKRK